MLPVEATAARITSNFFRRGFGTFVPLLALFHALKLAGMSAYASLLGKRVEALYRASDLHLSAVGTLVGDSGHSIYIEDLFVQNGREKRMRIEIPYPHLSRVFERGENQNSPANAAVTPVLSWPTDRS